MAETKSETMTFRLTPTTKQGLREIAERESRTYANSLEWLIKNYFETRGLPWPSENANNEGGIHDRGPAE
jgi:hypothetical protein